MNETTTPDPRTVASRFYDAFASRDADTMNALYADNADFEDPAFGPLDVSQTRAMWSLLTGRAEDLELEYEVVAADGERVAVNWTARYTFSQTGRHVVNHIRAVMTVRDGHIVHHKDEFDFYRWAKQAFGLTGVVLGWTSFFQNKVRERARGALS